MSYLGYSFAARCHNSCFPVKPKSSAVQNRKEPTTWRGDSRSFHRPAIHRLLGRSSRHPLRYSRGWAVHIVEGYSSISLMGRQEQYQSTRTGSNGSLTSQTEVFDPTLNSRSSLVIAASMSASRSQFPASSALPEAKSLRLTVPVLVYHHDAQQHAERKDEDSVNVMRDGIANGVAESDHDDHSSDIEEDSEELHCSRDKVSIRCSTPADVLLAKRTISPMAHLSSSVLMTRIN